MDCKEIIKAIDDYFDDFLSDDDRIVIDKHLGQCFQCNIVYTNMNNYFQQLKNFSSLIEKPISLQAEINDELYGEKPPEEIKPKKSGFRLFKRD